MEWELTECFQRIYSTNQQTRNQLNYFSALLHFEYLDIENLEEFLVEQGRAIKHLIFLAIRL